MFWHRLAGPSPRGAFIRLAKRPFDCHRIPLRDSKRTALERLGGLASTDRSTETTSEAALVMSPGAYHALMAPLSATIMQRRTVRLGRDLHDHGAGARCRLIAAAGIA